MSLTTKTNYMMKRSSCWINSLRTMIVTRLHTMMSSITLSIQMFVNMLHLNRKRIQLFCGRILRLLSLKVSTLSKTKKKIQAILKKATNRKGETQQSIIQIVDWKFTPKRVKRRFWSPTLMIVWISSEGKIKTRTRGRNQCRCCWVFDSKGIKRKRLRPKGKVTLLRKDEWS